MLYGTLSDVSSLRELSTILYNLFIIITHKRIFIMMIARD